MPERKTKATRATKGPPRPAPSPESLPSLSPGGEAGFIPPHGGYKDLLSYQKALVDIGYIWIDGPRKGGKEMYWG